MIKFSKTNLPLKFERRKSIIASERAKAKQSVGEQKLFAQTKNLFEFNKDREFVSL
jgi:hypothetical protein